MSRNMPLIGDDEPHPLNEEQVDNSSAANAWDTVSVSSSSSVSIPFDSISSNNNNNNNNSNQEQKQLPPERQSLLSSWSNPCANNRFVVGQATIAAADQQQQQQQQAAGAEIADLQTQLFGQPAGCCFTLCAWCEERYPHWKYHLLQFLNMVLVYIMCSSSLVGFVFSNGSFTAMLVVMQMFVMSGFLVFIVSSEEQALGQWFPFLYKKTGRLVFITIIGICGLSLPRIGTFCGSLAALCLAVNWKLLDMEEDMRASLPIRTVIIGNNAQTINNNHQPVPAGAVEMNVTRIGTYGSWEQLQDVESGFTFFHHIETGALRPGDQIPPEIDQNIIAV